MIKDDGGPAFPQLQDVPGGPYYVSGMSLRDYFAAHAGDQLATGTDEKTMAYYSGIPQKDGESFVDYYHRVEAALRYKLAAAMLAERSK